MGKRAVESITRRQFSNRIDLNAIVARRHTGPFDQNYFHSTNNPVKGSGVYIQNKFGNLKEIRFRISTLEE